MTLEEDNAALRNAVETRLATKREKVTAEMSPMVASIVGCKPAMDAATAALCGAGCCDGPKPSPPGAAAKEPSDAYSEWTPPDYARREEAIKGFNRIVEAARPAREARAMHPSSRAFFELCEQLKEVHAAKSRDYGSATDPLANIRNGAEFVGVEPWRAAMVRLSDKVTRLATYCRTGRLEHEGVEDTLLDLASYSLLTLLMHRECRDGSR